MSTEAFVNHRAELMRGPEDPKGAALNLRYRFTLRPKDRPKGRYCDAYWKWLLKGGCGAPPMPVGLESNMTVVLRSQCDFEFRSLTTNELADRRKELGP